MLPPFGAAAAALSGAAALLVRRSSVRAAAAAAAAPLPEALRDARCQTVWLKGYVDAGVPGPEHFEVRETALVPPPQDGGPADGGLADGAIVVQALALSVDPYLRGRIKRKNPLAVKRAKGGTDIPLESDTGEAAMSGFVSGKVVASRHPDWAEGDLIAGALPFSTLQVLTAAKLRKSLVWKLTGLVDESRASLGVGVLGMPGATAYGGLVDVLRPHSEREETLFVSSAAGAVGSLVGQIAKNVYGCTVIGSCGGPEKGARVVSRYGFDHAIDYLTLAPSVDGGEDDGGKADLDRRLAAVAPDGIDMYFECVGGVHFEAAMTALRPHGRIAVCGKISNYNDAEKAYNKIDIGQMIYSYQRIEGFVAARYMRRGDFLPAMARWVDEGKIIPDETFFDGIEQWPRAFQSLFLRGDSRKSGKVVVRITPAGGTRTRERD